MANIQQPPRAKKVEHITEMHGHTLKDNYYWLKDQTISNPEVLAQISAENAYAEAVLAKSKPLQEKMYKEMLHREKRDIETTIPDQPEKEIEYTQVGDWFYWEKAKNKDDRFKIRYRKKAEAGTEEVILDLNEIARQYEYFHVSEIQYTPDYNYILIDCLLSDTNDKMGKSEYTLIFDVNTKLFLERLESRGMVYVNPQNEIIYQFGDKVFLGTGLKRHQIGSDTINDELLFEEKSNGRIWDVHVSESKKYIMLLISDYFCCEWWLLDLEKPEAMFECFKPRVNDEFYYIMHSGNYFYIMTNTDNAHNFKIMRTTADKTDKKYWQEIIPHSESICYMLPTLELTDYSVFKNYLVLREIENGVQRIKFINNQTDEIKEIKFEIDVPFYQLSCTGGDYDGDKFCFEVSSLARKLVEYEFDFVTGEIKRVWEKELNDYQPDLYQSEIVFATAKDDAKVPIHLFYRKDLFKKDGTNPLFIEGYSAYGCLDNGFIPERLSLIDRGFVYAYSQMRGCAYYGYKWYRDGVRDNKKNRFDDFIACTDYLIEKKYADKNRVVAYGASAGGQIMGYIANKRPDLYKCIISMIPSVDTMNKLIDHDNHNSESEVVECGKIQNKNDFEYILSHDILNNIQKQAYPNIISIASLYDTQVGYWEPIKWVNKIRDYKTDSNQQFVLMLKDGHGGATLPYWYERICSTAYAYVCDLFGITE